MASAEVIQLHQDDQRNSRLQPTGTSRSSVTPPSYDDIQAGTAFTLPRGVAAPVDTLPAMRQANRTGSLPSMNRMTLTRGGAGTMYGTLRLRDRIENRKARRPASITFWQNLKHVWWPKIPKKLGPVLNFELWRSHIKQVEGHFGTAVASYFVLLRWLFYMNMAIFVVWTLFVSIPQFVVEPYLAAQKAAMRPCIYLNNSNYTCSSNKTIEYAYIILPSCKTLPRTATEAKYCPNNGNQSITLKVFTNSSTKGGIQSNSSACPYGLTKYRFCPLPPTPAYDPISLVTGQGGYSDTWLFLGHYVNFTVFNGISYNRPVAYLVCTAMVYGISFVMLIVSLGRAYIDNTVKFSSLIKANFCNKVFSAWDYKIIDARAVKLKKVLIKTELQEELAEHKKQSTGRELRELIRIVLIRIVTNTIVIVMMVGAGAAIISATYFTWRQLVAQDLSAKGLTVPIIIIFVIVGFPIIFHVIASFERYKTHSGHEKMTFIRATSLRVATLLVYIAAAFAAIQCTQSKDIQAAILDTFGKNNTTYCKNQCWESFVGEDLYNLQILEFLFIIIFTIVYEAGRNLLYKGCSKRVENKILKSIVSRASFSIADSVNDLVYYQLLMWLGFFFSPVLLLFQIIILFITFYVKKYSLMLNLEPEKDALFRGTRTTVLSTVFFLIVLTGAVFPIGFAVSRFRPSYDCGPFQQRETFLSVITDVINASPSSSQEFFKYISSSGFAVPVILVLIGVICILSSVVIAKKKLLRLTIAHLDAEGVALIHTDEAVLPRLVQLRQSSTSALLAAQNTAAYDNETYLPM